MLSYKLFKAVKLYNYRPISYLFNLVSVHRNRKLNYCTCFHPRYFSTSLRMNNNFTDTFDNAKAEKDSNIVKLTVHFPQENTERVIEAEVGMTVMEAVLKHDNTLLPSACEGQLCCRTCHCLIEEEKMHYFSEPENAEEDLLDAFSNCQSNSRLACQLKIVKQFDNVQIEVVPELKEKSEMEESG